MVKTTRDSQLRTVNITYCINDEAIDDIMVSSLEGGVTSMWCDEVAVVGTYLGEYASEQISRGGWLAFLPKDFYEEFGGPVSLNKEGFLNGLDKYISDYAFLHNNGLSLIDENGLIDPGEIDAEIADSIVQLGLFGEIVYG